MEQTISAASRERARVLRPLCVLVDPDIRIGGEQRAELTDNVACEQIAGQMGVGVLGRSETMENRCKALWLA
jgi:hypothetical protein